MLSDKIVHSILYFYNLSVDHRILKIKQDLTELEDLICQYDLKVRPYTDYGIFDIKTRIAWGHIAESVFDQLNFFFAKSDAQTSLVYHKNLKSWKKVLKYA